MNQPAVEIRGLVMRYGATDAVDGLSLTVEPGTITAVLGPNGAGKTTSMETCEGFRRPHGGSVRVLGLDPVADARRLRPKVGVMLQNGGAWSGARASEMLAHIASLYAHPLDPAGLSERLGLGDCGNTAYRRLSGGQQQRLNLAMAVVGRPELVFLDEPTAGLDPQARHVAWALIGELRTSGVTVILTTHFMDEAEQLADQIHILDHGRAIASGTAAELTSAGSNHALRFSTDSRVDVDSLIFALAAGAAVHPAGPGSYVITGSARPDLLATFTAWCARNDVMPTKLLVDQRTLEDVFLDLTGRELR